MLWLSQTSRTLVLKLPVGAQRIVTCILERNGWLIGSTARKLVSGESDFSDIDLVLNNRGALHWWLKQPKRVIKNHLWAIDGQLFHVAHKMDFRLGPMFDVNMIGISREGIGIRPLSGVERRQTYDLKEILRHIANRQFRILPFRARSPYYQAKLDALLSAGWKQIDTAALL